MNAYFGGPNLAIIIHHETHEVHEGKNQFILLFSS